MFRWVTVCALLLVCFPGLSSAETPADVYGVWSGMLTEAVVEGKRYQRYEVTITLAPNAYHVDYNDLGCGGNLRLVRNTGRFFRFQDELNYGQDACAKGGRTELRIIGFERAAFQWFDASGVLKVEGYLKRHRQVII